MSRIRDLALTILLVTEPNANLPQDAAESAGAEKVSAVGHSEPTDTNPGEQEENQPCSCGRGAPCRGRVYRWARRQGYDANDAEDFCQEVCLRCLLGKPTFHGEAQFGTWLYRVVVNVHNDSLRRKLKRLEDSVSPVLDDLLEMAQTMSQEAEAVSDLVRIAPGEIPLEQREVLTWKYIDDRSHAEIAEELGIQETSARQKVWRARAAFKRAYDALMQNEGEG